MASWTAVFLATASHPVTVTKDSLLMLLGTSQTTSRKSPCLHHPYSVSAVCACCGKILRVYMLCFVEWLSCTQCVVHLFAQAYATRTCMNKWSAWDCIVYMYAFTINFSVLTLKVYFVLCRLRLNTQRLLYLNSFNDGYAVTVTISSQPNCFSYKS